MRKNMDKIIIEGGAGEIIEKKSRFIANIRPVSTEEEALEVINEYKKKYWDARHNCSAYIIGNNIKFSDDGEPSGTAGKPMLDVLSGQELTNVVVVVTRYFGGILLGTGGLVRAYKGAVQEGLKACKIGEKKSGKKFEIITDYNGLGKIQYIAANDSGINILDTEYTDKVKLLIVCENDSYGGFEKKVMESTAGQTEFSDTENIDYFECDGEIRFL